MSFIIYGMYNVFIYGYGLRLKILMLFIIKKLVVFYGFFLRYIGYFDICFCWGVEEGFIELFCDYFYYFVRLFVEFLR